MKIIFTDDALNDIEASVLWYEEQKKGLGEDFSFAIGSALERISANPLASTPKSKNIRGVLIDKFPFWIFFTVKSDIYILAVFHTSRNPKQWKKRRKSDA